MNCRHVEKWVNERGTGNLSAAALQHLSGCTDCRKLMDDIRLIDRLIASSATPDPGESYWGNFSLRVERNLDRPVSAVSVRPLMPAWRLVLGRLWIPAVGVALLVVVANQQLQVVPGTQTTYEPPIADSFIESSGQTTPLSQTEQSRSSGAQAEVSPNRSFSVTARESKTPQDPRRVGGQKNAISETPTRLPTPSDPVLAKEEGESEKVWPDRQIIIMGEVDSSEPAQPVGSDKVLASQNSYGEYERQLAQSSQDIESTLTPAGPGRLLGAPATPVAGGVDSQSPAEAMRRFDEIAELRELIARVEAVPVDKRVNSQWSQWSTAWFRLGMLTDQRDELDRAISAVIRYQSERRLDATARAEWVARQTQLESRRTAIR